MLRDLYISGSCAPQDKGLDRSSRASVHEMVSACREGTGMDRLGREPEILGSSINGYHAQLPSSSVDIYTHRYPYRQMFLYPQDKECKYD